MADRGEIELRLLGQVEADRNGQAVNLGGPRQRALLALLVSARGRPITADRLVEELWHGNAPDGAYATLQSYVSRLRSALQLPTAITSAESAYRLDAPHDRVDAWLFEGLVEEGAAAAERGAVERASERFGAALSLWRGTAFGDLADDGLLRTEAERLDTLRLTALEGRLAADLDLVGLCRAGSRARATRRRAPLPGAFLAHLMLALYRAGRQKDALDAYRRVRELLSRSWVSCRAPTSTTSSGRSSATRYVDPSCAVTNCRCPQAASLGGRGNWSSSHRLSGMFG